MVTHLSSSRASLTTTSLLAVILNSRVQTMPSHWPVSHGFSEHTCRPSHTTKPRCAFGCTGRKISNTTREKILVRYLYQKQSLKPAAHESPRLRYRSVAAGGAGQERPRTTCAHKLHPHLAARGRETNICCVWYFSPGASMGASWFRRVRGSAGVLWEEVRHWPMKMHSLYTWVENDA